MTTRRGFVVGVSGAIAVAAGATAFWPQSSSATYPIGLSATQSALRAWLADRPHLRKLILCCEQFNQFEESLAVEMRFLSAGYHDEEPFTGMPPSGQCVAITLPEHREAYWLPRILVGIDALKAKWRADGIQRQLAEKASWVRMRKAEFARREALLDQAIAKAMQAI